MAMTRLDKEVKQVDQSDLEKVCQLLMYRISSIERDVLARYKSHSGKLMDDLIWRYHQALVDLTGQLTNISKHLFRNTLIKHVKPYKSDLAAPDNYRIYLFATQNITNVICYEVLEQTEMDAAYFIIERWIWIMKNAFEVNDFYIASSVINALRSASMLKLNFEENISPLAKSILLFFEDLLPNHAAVYQMQKDKFESGEEVVPILSTLAKMMDGIEQQPLSDDEKGQKETHQFIRKHKVRLSSDFMDMQDRLRWVLDRNTADIVRIFSCTPGVGVFRSSKFSHSKLQVDLGKLVAHIKLYDPFDDYYFYQTELKFFVHKLNELANHYRETRSAFKAESRVFNCMGIKAIIKDSKSSTAVKLENIRQLKTDSVCKSCRKIMCMLNAIEEIFMGLIENEEIKRWQGISKGRRTYSGSELSSTGLFAVNHAQSSGSQDESSRERPGHAKS